MDNNKLYHWYCEDCAVYTGATKLAIIAFFTTYQYKITCLKKLVGTYIIFTVITVWFKLVYTVCAVFAFSCLVFICHALT